MKKIPFTIIIAGISLLLACLQAPLPQEGFASETKRWLTVINIGWGLSLFVGASYLLYPVWKYLPEKAEAVVNTTALVPSFVSDMILAVHSLATSVVLFGGILFIIGAQVLLDLPISWRPVLWMGGFTAAQLFGHFVWWMGLRPDKYCA